MPNNGNGSSGNLLSSFTLAMTDDALVKIDFANITQNHTTFTDVGFMPIDMKTISGLPLPNGMNKAFIQYTSDGVQNFAVMDNTLVPSTATYSHLLYQIVAYNGDAKFGFAADGTAR